MTFGLTSSGFIPKRLEDIRGDLEVAFRSAFGAGIKTTPDTVFGKLIGVLADDLTTVWELAEAVYGSAYPNSASGQSLARLGQITGITPNPAVESTVVVYLAGTNTTVVPAGTRMSVVTSEEQFELVSAVVLSGSQISVAGITRVGSVATANSIAHGRLVGSWIFISGANEVEYNGLHQIDTVPDPDNFTYAVTGTPASPATGVITGDPATAGNARSVDTGAIQALAGTLTQIVNPVIGWDQVENALDATLGANAETDTAFRARRIAALQGIGGARLEAIRGSLLLVAGVSAAIVFENDTGDVVSGRPPHSIECLVLGGVDQDILDAVWDRKAAGIETFGTTSGVVVDSQGESHTTKFSRPNSILIWLEIDLTVDAEYPATGDTLVQDAVLAYASTLIIGQDVIVFPTLISSFASVPGITDVVIRIGTSASPTLDNNIVIAPTDIAIFDSSRITILSV